MTATNLKNCPMDDHRLILRAIAFGVSRLVPRHGKHCTNRYPPGFPPWQLWINDRTPSDVGDGEYVPRSFKLNDDGHGTPKLSDEVRALLVENMRRFESVPPHTRAAPPAPGEALPSVEELDDLFVSVVAEGGSTRDAVAAIRHRCLQSKPPVEAQLRTWKDIGADRLADEVDALIARRVIDSRSPAGDALLDYRDPPRTPRSDRLAELEEELRDLRAGSKGDGMDDLVEFHDAYKCDGGPVTGSDRDALWSIVERLVALRASRERGNGGSEEKGETE